jgi:chitodextrinase
LTLFPLLLLAATANAANITLAWDAPTNAADIIGYRHYWGIASHTDTNSVTSTKKQAALNSMVSGTKYWFRVAAIGAAGQSAWSDPVPLFAP